MCLGFGARWVEGYDISLLDINLKVPIFSFLCVLFFMYNFNCYCSSFNCFSFVQGLGIKQKLSPSRSEYLGPPRWIPPNIFSGK